MNLTNILDRAKHIEIPQKIQDMITLYYEKDKQLKELYKDHKKLYDKIYTALDYRIKKEVLQEYYKKRYEEKKIVLKK